MLEKQLLKQTANVSLRLASLGAKLLLTLYMGRFLGLSDLGVYGLVFSAVTIASGALGFRYDYVVARELVGADRVMAFSLVKDQIAFLIVNYVIFGFLIYGAHLLGLLGGKIALTLFVIAVFDNLSGAMTTNLIAMGSPLVSTALFFLRAGLWCLVAIFLGLLWPVLRSVDLILALWAAGEVMAVGLNFWIWRKQPWAEVLATPVDWPNVMRSIRRCFPIWLGTIGAMLAISVDRFVVSAYLDLEQVGVLTFYSSFAIAILSLVQSGFFAFSYPRLIACHQAGDTESFWRETRKTGWQVAGFVMLFGCFVGFAIPFSSPLFNKPELAVYAPTLWLLLIGIWIRANADTFYYVLYARRQDRALWLGSLLFLIPAVVGNLALVPWIGLEGVGYSSILACSFLLVWRLWHVFR